MKILICDDDEFAIDINTAYVKKCFKKYKVRFHIHSFLQINTTLHTFIENHTIDMAILDIDMGNQKDGIFLARTLKQQNPNIFIIFITEHKELSFEAFDVAAFALIPKPIQEENLFQHLKRALVYRNGLRVTKNPAALIKIGPNYIAKSNIISLEKDKKSVVIYTSQSMYAFTSGLNTLKEQLPDYFVYANRSVIINVKYVTEFDKKKIQMINRKVYSLSKKNYDNVYIQLKPYITE